MSRQIAVKPYKRAFRRPLRTARGEWAIREGFVLRVEEDGQIGYGEVAPLPEFGSETVAEAQGFLQELVRDSSLSVPVGLSCCAFALSAAGRDACPQASAGSPRDYPISALLPAGSAALSLASEKIAAGYRSMKWKIGVEPLAKELAEARSLLETLPNQVTIRFDANGSLSPQELEAWLDLLQVYSNQIEYMEQPLAVGQEHAMAEAMQRFQVPIALDESLNGASASKWLRPNAWSGPLVVKPVLGGDVNLLAERLAPVASQVVLSSAFETGIGLENGLGLADMLPEINRPIGFDTLDAFDDDLQPLCSASSIAASARHAISPELIWNSI